MKRPHPPAHRQREVLALAAVAALSLGLSFLGASTASEEIGAALLWPLSGFLVLWLLHRGPRAGLADGAVISASAALGLWLTGVGAPASVVGGLVVLVQPLVTVALVRRLAPGLTRRGPDRTSLATLGALGGLALSLLGGVLAVGAVLAVLTVGSGSALSWSTVVLWLLRDLAAVVVVVPVGLATFHRRSGRAGRAARTRTGPLHRGSRPELVAVLTLSVALFAGTFVLEVLPLSFPLLVATGWLGLRFEMVVTTWHTAVFTAAIAAATMLDRGPFVVAAAGEDVQAASLLQAFVVLMGAAGLVVSAERSQVHALNAELMRSAGAHRAQADLFGQMIDAMTEGVMVVDDREEVLAINTALLGLLGGGQHRPTERLRGLMGHHLDGTPLEEHEHPSHRALAGERVIREQVLHRTVGEPDQVLTVTALPLPDHDGSGRRRAMLLVEDVTVEHDRRADLVTFAQMAAHDLRNPLTAIKGWTGLMGRRLDDTQDVAPAELRDYLRRTEDASRRMDDLIEHLLDRATGDVEQPEEEVDLGEVLARVARERGVQDLVLVTGAPVVCADPGMVHQLLDNLLANAVKFARPGTVPEIVCTSRTERAGVVVSITDNGRGVPAGQLEDIFTDGHRAHAGQVDGTGLGLAVCRRIAGRLGGTLRALDNPDGPGLVLELVLPSERVVAVPEPTGRSEARRRGTGHAARGH